MRNLITTAVEIAGAALIVVGIGMISIPAAFITAGALTIAGSYLAVTR